MKNKKNVRLIAVIVLVLCLIVSMSLSSCDLGDRTSGEVKGNKRAEAPTEAPTSTPTKTINRTPYPTAKVVTPQLRNTVSADLDNDGVEDKGEIYLTLESDFAVSEKMPDAIRPENPSFIRASINNKIYELDISYAYTAVDDVFPIKLDNGAEAIVLVGWQSRLLDVKVIAYIADQLILLPLPLMEKSRPGEYDVSKYDVIGYEIGGTYLDGFKVEVVNESTGLKEYIPLDPTTAKEPWEGVKLYDEEGKLLIPSSVGIRPADSKDSIVIITDGNKEYLKIKQYFSVSHMEPKSCYVESIITWDKDLKVKLVKQELFTEEYDEI